MKKTNSTNDGLKVIILFLKKAGKEKHAAIWGDLAKRLSSPRKNRSRVNISRLSRNTIGDDLVAVPGKLLGSGSIGHSVTVAAFSFSSQAREKINFAGGKCITFEELVNINPKGSNVKIIGGI